MNTLMNVILFILFAHYIAALLERLVQPEIINEDGESEGLDQYYESEYLSTRDYYLAADHGFGRVRDYDF